MSAAPTLPAAPEDAEIPSEQVRAPYLEAVAAYGQRAPRRLHVPGHGGGAGADPALRAALGPAAFALDIPPDIGGVDLGLSPTALQRAETLAAAAYGAGRTWFLTNGATQGNHALCLAIAPTGAAVVVQRNCHGSAIDGLVLSGGSPSYVSPGYDEETEIATVVTPELLRAALAEQPDARAALLVSPTYFGMVADVAGCARVAHEAGATLVVDSAWGPHLGFHPALPASALAAGADAVLTSTHKHAGSMGQSAMLHVAPGRDELRRRLERTVRIVRSTSPSSVLMASLDAARRQLAVRGVRVLGDTIAVAERLRDGIEAIDGARVLDRSWSGERPYAWDPLRVVVDVRGAGVAGTAVADRLRNAHDAHVELSTHAGLLLVVPLGMTATAADDIAAALGEAIAATPSTPARPPHPAPAHARRPLMSPREAFLGATEVVPRAEAVGRLSAEAISAYPPGIPTLLPGEPITVEALELLSSLHRAGVRLHGASDPELDTVTVTAEPHA